MRLDEETLGQFSEWLSVNTSLGQRSINDTVSRLKRLAGFVDPLDAATPDEFRYKLTAAPGFSDLSTYVRSQLKRAGTLYRAFAGKD